MFRDVAATGVAAWTPSLNTLPSIMPQEGAGDSSGSFEFKDNQYDMSLDIDSLQQGHTSQSRSSGQKRTSEFESSKTCINTFERLDPQITT